MPATPPTHPAYLPFLLVWALPVVAGQWLVGWRYLWRWRAVWVPVVLALAAYFSLADAVAIQAHIWTFDRHQLAGIWLGPVPLEEVLFYLLTAAMVAQGFILLWSAWTERVSLAAGLRQRLARTPRSRTPSPGPEAVESCQP